MYVPAIPLGCDLQRHLTAEADFPHFLGLVVYRPP